MEHMSEHIVEWPLSHLLRVWMDCWHEPTFQTACKCPRVSNQCLGLHALYNLQSMSWAQ
jgi:hypothetical protein